MNRRDERFFRKQLLVYPRFQLTVIALNWMIITLVFGVLKIQAARVFADLSPLVGMSNLSAGFSADYLGYLHSRLDIALFGAYGVAMVCSGAFTLLATYRFAGPVVRMKRFFTDLADPAKPIAELQFRKGDFFSDLPPLVNQAVVRVKNEHESVVRHLPPKAS